MKKKNYLIYGFSKSGQWALKFLIKKANKIFVYDQSEEKRKLAINYCDVAQNCYVLRGISADIIKMCDILVLSPGVSIFDKWVKKAQKLGKKIISELELGFTKNKNKIIAITGTNGKTTTTRLVAHILNTAHKKAVCVGNIGYPLTQARLENGEKTIFVCETSSFQLEAIENFSPFIACILNITPDHLDRHKTFKNYANTKFKIFENQTSKDYFVCNKSLKIPKPIKSKRVEFSLENNVSFGCFIKNDNIVFSDKNSKLKEVCKNNFNLIGIHNLENILAAITICKILKIKNKHIIKALNSFKLSNHRLQRVYETNSISFYDDSKATNIDATLCACKSFDKPINLILGGSDKGYNYDLLFKNLPNNIKNILICGQVRYKLEQSAKKYNLKNVSIFDTLKQATQFACKTSTPGEIVLLSPASASFDEFENYKQRGEKFLEYIKEFYGV